MPHSLELTEVPLYIIYIYIYLNFPILNHHPFKCMWGKNIRSVYNVGIHRMTMFIGEI